MSIGALIALADRCVQCGLCLPACPTYAADRIEAESPRGRIALARAIASATVAPTALAEAHLDQCLACGSCESVCPARVEFGALLIGARGAQRQRRPAGWMQRSIEWLVVHRRRLNLLLSAYRMLHPLLPRAMCPLPRPPARTTSPRFAGASREATRVALFTGCVSDAYEARVRASLRRLCSALGVDVVAPEAQVCCGTLHAHSGRTDTSQVLAVHNRAAFAGVDAVLTLASGCHGAVRDALGAHRAHDALEWLSTRADALIFRSPPRRIGVHAPCTQRNVARSYDAMHDLLARVKGLQIVLIDAGWGCCGGSGTHMLSDPVHAERFRAPLLAQAHAAGVDAIASANMVCRLHLANGTDLPVLHPLELLADALVTNPAITHRS